MPSHREQLIAIIKAAVKNVKARPESRRGPYVIKDSDLEGWGGLG